MQNRDKKLKVLNEWKKRNPWRSSYDNAKRRCSNPNERGYKNYGGKGIKFLMTIADFKFLWFRDRAYLLKRPSIDRKESDKDYTLDNCRFIELGINNGAPLRNRTHCKYGHKFTVKNTIIIKHNLDNSGRIKSRKCRTCIRIKSNEYYHKHTERIRTWRKMNRMKKRDCLQQQATN